MKLITLIMLLVLTFSSGFAQFAMHMCDDAGVLLATDNCSNADKCCEQNSNEGDEHCSTEYIYVLTAKFKSTRYKINLNVDYFDMLLPSLRIHPGTLSLAHQTKHLINYSFRQSSLDQCYTGVFLI